MTKSEFDSSGRTAIVTGGRRGIGKVICLALAQVGANIVVSGRSPLQLRQLLGKWTLWAVSLSRYKQMCVARSR